jgi:hypothetical protein
VEIRVEPGVESCHRGEVESSDAELLSRQAALQAEGASVLAAVEPSFGLPLLATGSYVSGLMCWRDLDVMACVGAAFTPADVVGLLARLVELPGVVGFAYADERGPRAPTPAVRDERYHVPVTMVAGRGTWRVDLSLWLHDVHANVTTWHESLRSRITPEQRLRVLRIKDVWHRLPSYPDQVGGQEIYAAVLEDGVRDGEEFAGWLAARGLPTR